MGLLGNMSVCTHRDMFWPFGQSNKLAYSVRLVWLMEQKREQRGQVYPSDYVRPSVHPSTLRYICV